MPGQLEHPAGVANVACFDPVDLQIAVGKIGNVEIFAFRTKRYAFSEPASLSGPNLTDVASFRRQDIKQRIWRGKPSSFGRATTTAVYRDRDGERSVRADSEALWRRSYADVIHQVWRIGGQIDYADRARAAVGNTTISLVGSQGEMAVGGNLHVVWPDATEKSFLP